MSLRSILTTAMILAAVLAVLISGALVALTTILHRTTATSGSSVESVRLAEEAEVTLLLHERARDGLVKRDLEGDLRNKLLEARQFVTTDHEARMLAEAESQADSYIAASRDPQRTAEVAIRQENAFGALEALVAINVAQSNAAQQDAARWDRVGTVLGIGVGMLVIGVAGGLLVWLRGRAFAPIFSLASTMERFGRGDRDARAVEHGPRELREMCIRFNEMASAIAAQRQAQMAFLGGVAHDLRTPLSVLQMSVTLLGPEMKQLSEERIRQTIERIGRQITRMERMLGDFLDIAKIEAGQLDLRFDTHDARKLVEEVVDLLEGASRKHRLQLRVPDHAVPLRCDQLRIGQVTTNLISNAIKYSPEGGVVDVVLESRADEVELRVTDHGIGIAEHDRVRMFEPFKRVGLSKETAPGTGLGLFIVRQIVEAHQGHIEVESAPGEGSTFRVFLPIQNTAP